MEKDCVPDGQSSQSNGSSQPKQARIMLSPDTVPATRAAHPPPNATVPARTATPALICFCFVFGIKQNNFHYSKRQATITPQHPR